MKWDIYLPSGTIAYLMQLMSPWSERICEAPDANCMMRVTGAGCSVLTEFGPLISLPMLGNRRALTARKDPRRKLREESWVTSGPSTDRMEEQ